MPINVFGNNSSSHDSGNKIDTSLFIQKPYLTNKFIKRDIDEDLYLKNRYRTKTSPDPISIRVVCCKIYAYNLFPDPSIIKNISHIDLNDKNITNARLIQVNELPQIDFHLTAKLYVDNSVDEPTLARINQNNHFNIYNLSNINNSFSNTQAVNDNQVITKTYVDQFLCDNERKRREVGL